MYDIDRKTASKMLKVSMRTVDRYIVAKKLSTQQHDGRIWLNRKEIHKLRSSKKVDNGGDTSKPKMSIDNSMSTVDDMSIDSVDIMSTSDSQIKSRERVITGDEVYKNLFEELQQELKNKQERLEGANYRVGQLEALLKDSVPRLDYQRALNAEKAEKEEIRTKLEMKSLESEQLSSKLKEEKTDKRVYLIILFILMLLQPIWLILSLR